MTTDLVSTEAVFEESGFAWLWPRADGWQFGEQGLLDAIFDKIGDGSRWCVEFGAGDGDELPVMSDRLLSRGWNGLLIESDQKASEVLQRTHRADFIKIVNRAVAIDGPDGIDAIMSEHGVPADPDLMVVDVDGTEFYIVSAMRSRPRILCVEHQDTDCPLTSGLPVAPPVELCGQKFASGFSVQANAQAIRAAVEQLGYVRIAVTRCNSLFARKDEAARLYREPKVRLNIGCGPHTRDGWVNIDADNGLSAYPLGEYADGSVDEIYASHVLEHFPYHESIKVVREWVRVLKPGGRIRIAVPDFNTIIDGLRSGRIVFNLAEAYVVGGHTDEHDRHGALFTEQKLGTIMKYAGLESIHRWQSDIGDCSALSVSLNLQGVKREFLEPEHPSVVAVISQPRIAFTDSMVSLHRGLRAIGVKSVDIEPCADDIVYVGGAFWEKYITQGIKRAMVMKASRILFADYDGVFNPSDVLRLNAYMDEHPDVSAVFAVQVSRHNDRPLVHMENIEYVGDETPVQLGHFGLTIIRSQVFQTLPKPWFWSMPNPVSMEWDEKGHCDADITFWRVMAECGHKVVQLNDIQVGHMDLCVKWLTEKGIAYQPVKLWNKRGKPADARFNPDCYRPKPKEEKK